MPTMKSVQTAAPGTVQIAESEEAFAVTEMQGLGGQKTV